MTEREFKLGLKTYSQFIYLTNFRESGIMNELSLTRLHHKERQRKKKKGILKIEQCTTSEQALEV